MVWLGLLLLLAACDNTPAAPTPTPIVISKLLATAYISPTPNEAQIQATRAAASPTPAPVTPTRFPTITPFIGTFIGQAPQESVFNPITEPLFGAAPELSPTANVARCDVPVQAAYLDIWQTDGAVSQGLGCPIQDGFGFFGEVQIFENGAMYRNPDTRETWAVVSGAPSGRYWFVQAPPEASVSDILAPAGQRLPRGDFGSMWASVEGLRETTGFAITDVQRVGINIQRFEKGTFFQDVTVGQVFALLVDGTVYGPFEVAAPIEGEQAPTLSPLDALTALPVVPTTEGQ